MKDPGFLGAGLILVIVGIAIWVGPSALVDALSQLPKPLRSVYFLYFRQKRIQPDSAVGYGYYQLAALFGVLVGLVLLITVLIDNVR